MSHATRCEGYDGQREVVEQAFEEHAPSLEIEDAPAPGRDSGAHELVQDVREDRGECTGRRPETPTHEVPLAATKPLTSQKEPMMKNSSRGTFLASALAATFVVASAPLHAQLPDPGMQVDRSRTALVITDPQNDFLSPDGVTWGVVGESVTENNTVANIGRLLEAAKTSATSVARSGRARLR